MATADIIIAGAGIVISVACAPLAPAAGILIGLAYYGLSTYAEGEMTKNAERENGKRV